jgi:hypothetical protein
VPLAGQVQPDPADAVPVLVVRQQVVGELVDLGGAQLAGAGGGFAVQEQAVEDEVRVRAADVGAAGEHRSADPRGLGQRAKGPEGCFGQVHLRGEVGGQTVPVP